LKRQRNFIKTPNQAQGVHGLETKIEILKTQLQTPHTGHKKEEK